MKKTFVAMILILGLVATSWADDASMNTVNSQAVDKLPQDDPFFTPNSVSRSPFEDELNTLRFKRDLNGVYLFTGLGIGVGGFIATSTFATLRGLNRIDDNVNLWGQWSSYTVTAAGVGLLIWGFTQWMDNANRYNDTVRLASNYYNIQSQ